MTDVIIAIFTIVTGIATAVYAYYSIQLWKATKRSSDLAALSTVMSLLMPLAEAVERAKLQGDPNVDILERFVGALGEIFFKRMLGKKSIKDDHEAIALISEFAGALKARNIDPSAIPGFKMLLDQLKE